jgi:hypothetical protein
MFDVPLYGLNSRGLLAEDPPCQIHSTRVSRLKQTDSDLLPSSLDLREQDAPPGVMRLRSPARLALQVTREDYCFAGLFAAAGLGESAFVST